MKKNSLWLIVIGLVVVVVLLVTDTLSIKCDSDELDVPEAIEDAGDDIEDAAEEITNN